MININLNSFAKMNMQKAGSDGEKSKTGLNNASTFDKNSLDNSKFDVLNGKIEETISIMTESGTNNIFSSPSNSSCKNENLESYQAAFDKLTKNLSSESDYGVN